MPAEPLRAATRPGLTGRRGWTTVAALSAVLVAVTGAQVSAAGSASAEGPVVRVSTQAALETRDRPMADVVAARAQLALAEAQRVEAERVAAEQAAAAQAAAEQAAAEQAAAEQARQQQAQQAAIHQTAPSGDRCSGEGWQRRRGEAALAALGPGASGSGFRVEFAGARSGYMGLAHLQRRVVEVFVRDCGSQSDELLRHVIAHELGHAFDTVRMDDASRAAWKAARGIPTSTPWYGCSGCSDFATPAGDFAEVYAQWLRGASSNRSRLAGAPGPGELQQLAGQFFGA